MQIIFEHNGEKIADVVVKEMVTRGQTVKILGVKYRIYELESEIIFANEFNIENHKDKADIVHTAYLEKC